MPSVLTDYLNPWDAVIFFGVPLALIIFVFVQEYWVDNH